MRMKGGRTAPVDCRPYVYDGKSASAPTAFRVVFEAAGYTYRYVLSVQRGEVVEEYLHRRKSGKGATATLFERANGKVDLGSSLCRKARARRSTP